MRTQIIDNAGAPAFLNPLPQALALLNGMGFMGKPSAGDGDDGHEDQQRPQAELKPAAFACRRFTHHRIVPDLGNSEQVMLGRLLRAIFLTAAKNGQTIGGDRLNRGKQYRCVASMLAAMVERTHRVGIESPPATA